MHFWTVHKLLSVYYKYLIASACLHCHTGWRVSTVDAATCGSEAQIEMQVMISLARHPLPFYVTGCNSNYIISWFVISKQQNDIIGTETIRWHSHCESVWERQRAHKYSIQSLATFYSNYNPTVLLCAYTHILLYTNRQYCIYSTYVVEKNGQ